MNVLFCEFFNNTVCVLIVIYFRSLSRFSWRLYRRVLKSKTINGPKILSLKKYRLRLDIMLYTQQSTLRCKGSGIKLVCIDGFR